MVEYFDVFPTPIDKEFLDRLVSEICWQQDHITLAGRTLPVPRLQCWMGDPHCHYSYSGIRLTPRPWHPTVLEIHQRVAALANCRFNSVLLNYYRNGKDSVAWHADDEPELGPDPVIASVSLGAERLFQLKRKQARVDESQNTAQLLLRSGSVLIMKNNIQNNWLHQVPKDKSLLSPRINLTFRQILRK